ncbi:MAG: glycoside hydrolase family 32 protein [Cyclobacteriaceae bacterium]
MKFNLIITLATVFALACSQNQSQEIPPSISKYRPLLHFTPPANWMNDPNGMVYYEGEYHLFYQYYPDSTVWGPMHWGHAVSADMVSWAHLPIALYPDDLGYIFSGSAVIDWKNTSGLGTEQSPPMVAIFTYHDPVGLEEGRLDFQTQGIAYSLDKGRTWEKYKDNPVLENPGIFDFRDPKVSWMEEFQKWIMILAVKDHISIYSSDDLINWIKESDFGESLGAHGGVWECPDLFKLKNQKGEEKWVMLVSINPGGPRGGSATQYFIGDFDGETFQTDDESIRWLDHGADNYAGVTWADIPEADGRRLFVGWMSNWQYAQVVPADDFRSAMTLPRELILRNTKRGNEVWSVPVEEIDKYFNSEVSFQNEMEITADAYVVSFEVTDAKNFSINFSNELGEIVDIKSEAGIFSFDRSQSGHVDFEEGFGVKHEIDFADITIQTIQIFVDKTSLEVFVNDGERVVTELVFPQEPYNKIMLKGVKEAVYSPIAK